MTLCTSTNRSWSRTNAVRLGHLHCDAPTWLLEIFPESCKSCKSAHIQIKCFIKNGFLRRRRDIDRLDAAAIFTADNAHDGIINCLDAVAGGTSANCGAPEIVTGGRDGAVRVWDPRQPTAVACMASAAAASSTTGGGPGGDATNCASRDCWSVAFGNAFSPDERCVCAGYDNGDLKLFDLRTMSQRWDCNVRNGICGIEFDRKDIPMNKLVVTTLEGGLHVYDARTQHPQSGMASVSERDAGRSLGTNGVISGTKSTVWCARHLPQNRDIFVTCGGTGSVRLWL